MPIHTEKIADWLLAGLELKSTLFHVGQYCGNWRASTAGHQEASFHVVLHGDSCLHLAARPGRAAESIRLSAGDAVFLLRDMPHCLSPLAAAPLPGHEDERMGSMQNLPDADAPQPHSVGLACGFFEFRSGLDDQLLALLPDHIVARHDATVPDGPCAVFDL